VTRHDPRDSKWPVAVREQRGATRTADRPISTEPTTPGGLAADLIGRAVAGLRRRIGLVTVTFGLVLAPVVAYSMLAVPSYAARGTIQASSNDSAMSPLLELAGAGGASEIETEVEIIKQRPVLLAVLKSLRLDVDDPNEHKLVTTDLAVASGQASPIRSELRRVRDSLSSLEIAAHQVLPVPMSLRSTADGIEVTLGDPDAPRVHTVAIGETLEDDVVTLAFAEAPTADGEVVELELVPDGMLVEDALARLGVAAIGNARKTTNLVEVTFTHPDREIAQAVVQGLMQGYLDQSLQWQRLSASSASEFIAEQLELAIERLQHEENALRDFAESERAVQLDTQAETTIENAAALEAERLQIELQERAIGSVIGGIKRNGKHASANLTGNFFDDPILAASIGSLTENETKLAMSEATLTPDHHEVKVLRHQVELQRGEVSRLMKSARKTLSARRSQLEQEIDTAMGSLASYPAKELQLARHMRDVEVNQRMYAFLLEKHQESEILEASTTTNKRIVEDAALPHKKSSPQRAKLVVGGGALGLMIAFAAAYLAHLLQRRLHTVKEVSAVIGYPTYGTVPAVDGQVGGDRLKPKTVWGNAHGPAAEAFRALAASICLVPAIDGRGRIIQVTSSQPGEGKSTVIANLAVALGRAGNRVLLIDLDLRRPVQHRTLGVWRAPGYADLFAQGGGPEQLDTMIQAIDGENVKVLAAGSKLPDTLAAVMASNLEDMLQYLATRFDYVLVDSPPAFVADTSMVARHVDLLLMVARPGVAERGGTRSAVDLLDRVDVAKGLVLNGVARQHTDYAYGSGYYSYGRRYDDPTDSVDPSDGSKPSDSNPELRHAG